LLCQVKNSTELGGGEGHKPAAGAEFDKLYERA